MIPYGHHYLDDNDIRSVCEVLKSDWLTTGPTIERFENALKEKIGISHACVMSSGTAALHSAFYAVGIGPGDEVIVPAISFVATSNTVLYNGGVPVFADVHPNSLLLDTDELETKITNKTRAVVAVDYAGQPCDYDRLQSFTKKHGLALIVDACHSLGGQYKSRKVGMLGDITAFSFHPVKSITMGEGGAVVTQNEQLANKMRVFRNHGISSDFRARMLSQQWDYDMIALGYNYRATDFQCALGISQLEKLDAFVKRRREIAAIYDERLRTSCFIKPLKVASEIYHPYHLYVVAIQGGHRQSFFQSLRESGIGANVHYKPIYLHSYYQKKLGYKKGLCPSAEKEFEKLLTLPIFPSMSDCEVDLVCKTLVRIERGLGI